MNFLKRYRAERGLSMADVAKDSGVSPTTIWKIERRGIVPKFPKRKKIALGMGITLAQFNAMVDPEFVDPNHPGHQAA